MHPVGIANESWHGFGGPSNDFHYVPPSDQFRNTPAILNTEVSGTARLLDKSSALRDNRQYHRYHSAMGHTNMPIHSGNHHIREGLDTKHRRDKTLSYPLHRGQIQMFPPRQFNANTSEVQPADGRHLIYQDGTYPGSRQRYFHPLTADSSFRRGELTAETSVSNVTTKSIGFMNGGNSQQSIESHSDMAVPVFTLVDGLRKSRSVLSSANQGEKMSFEANSFHLSNHKSSRSHDINVAVPGNNNDISREFAANAGEGGGGGGRGANNSRLHSRRSSIGTAQTVTGEVVARAGYEPVNMAYNTLPSVQPPQLMYGQMMHVNDGYNSHPLVNGGDGSVGSRLLKKNYGRNRLTAARNIPEQSVGSDQSNSIADIQPIGVESGTIRYYARGYHREQNLTTQPNNAVPVGLINDSPGVGMPEDNVLGNGLVDLGAATAINIALRMDDNGLQRSFTNDDGRSLGLTYNGPAFGRSNKSRLTFKYPSLQSIDQKNTLADYPERNLTYASVRGARRSNDRIDHASGVHRIFCVRHGERVDVVFGNKWVSNAFDQRGLYHRGNLNMPTAIPNRTNAIYAYQSDCPLTEIGAFQARLTGEAMRRQAIIIDQCYCSPALRSVQTAHGILQGLGVGDSIQIKVEPGLFEFLGWYERGIPQFISPAELKQLGYNIDVGYVPHASLAEFNQKEHYLDFYNRSHQTVLHALETNRLKATNILLCGHAATLEVCTRQLCGRSPRSYQEFNNVIRKVGYLGMNVCERSPLDNVWRMREPPIPPLQVAGTVSFDWKILL